MKLNFEQKNNEQKKGWKGFDKQAPVIWLNRVFIGPDVRAPLRNHLQLIFELFIFKQKKLLGEKGGWGEVVATSKRFSQFMAPLEVTPLKH